MTEEKIKQIIEFYLEPNSLRKTSKHFNISYNTIKKILLNNNIKLHSKEILNKIQSDIHKQIEESKKIKGYNSIKVDVEKLSCDILKHFNSLDELQKYWKTHTKREIDLFVKRKFNISYYIFKNIVLNYFKLEDRTLEESKKLGLKHLKEACLKKYGVDMLYKYGSKEFNDLMVKKYGVDNYFKTDDVRKMTHDRCFGTRLSDEYKQKISDTVKSKECQERTKKTCLERYGVEYTFQSENNIQKSQQTCLEKYGMKHPPKRKYCVNDVYFDSFPEVALYLFAINHNETIIRCPICFKYYYKNEEHSYYPDFLYKGQLIELKGGQFLKEDGTWQVPFDHTLDGLMEAKRQCALSNSVKILYPSDYKKYLDWFKKSKYKKIDFIVK